jgi:hypothetical protein
MITATRAARAIVLLALGSVGAGCAPRPQRAPVMVAGAARPCTVATTIGADKPLKDRVFPPQYWFALLLRGYQMSGDLERPAVTCGGAPVNLEGDGCPGETSAVRVNPGTVVSPRDVTVVNVSDSRRLVWVVTDRYADGQAEGPVAIAEIEPQGIAVHASGILRAYPENASLRLARLGTGTVLVAEGEFCTKPGSCERATRLVPLIGDHFSPKPLVDDKGTCLGPAFFPMHQAGTAHGRKHAKYEISVSITYGTDNISVREQLGLTGAEPAADSGTGSFVTRVQAERQVTLHDGNLLASAQSILTRWLAQQQ